MSWIDALLVVAGLALAATGHPLAGGLLACLGLVMPVLRLSARRRAGDLGLTHLVPAEAADAYADLRDAAALDGVPDGEAVMAAADHGLLEIAAALAGRPTQGGAQARLVRARVAAWAATADDLRAHHEAWCEAVAELDALAPLPPAPAAEAPPPDGGVLSGVMLVVLAPVFLTWELVTGSVRAALALADGVALRLRTGARALLWTIRAILALVGRTLRRWADLRRRVAAAAAEARARFIAARLRVRLRLRRLRHAT